MKTAALHSELPFGNLFQDSGVVTRGGVSDLRGLEGGRRVVQTRFPMSWSAGGETSGNALPRCRAKREQLKTFQGLLPESQAGNWP